MKTLFYLFLFLVVLSLIIVLCDKGARVKDNEDWSVVPPIESERIYAWDYDLLSIDSLEWNDSSIIVHLEKDSL